MNIYERICNICAEKGITITSLCRELTGYDENLSSWKKGRFKSDLIIRISERLGVSTDYLLKGDDKGKTTAENTFCDNSNSQNKPNARQTQQSQNTDKGTPKTIDRILKLMEQKNVSAHKLEVEAGLSNASIQAWKKGKAQASIASLQKIADYFDVSINYILYGKENEFTEKEIQLIEAIKSLSDSEVDKLNDFVSELIKKRRA